MPCLDAPLIIIIILYNHINKINYMMDYYSLTLDLHNPSEMTRL